MTRAPVKKVYGPYTRKDRRKHVIVVYTDGTKRTVSYPKWLMEQHLGTELGANETVDHIDRDFTNDDISNLRVLPRGQHVSDDVRRRQPITVVCVWCCAEFSTTHRVVNNSATYNKAGPFCSRKCTGEYGAVRSQGCPSLPAATRVAPRYTYREK